MEEERFIINQIKNIKQRKNKYKFNSKFFLILFLFNILPIKSNSEIYLIIDGSGTQSIINSGFSTKPSEIYVKGEKKGENTGTCVLEEDRNNITLKFQDQIESCEEMFSGLVNLIEIYLSNFDASKVTSMFGMFSGCSNLQYINFGNINTSLVKNMELMFFGCSQLKSIDLSTLVTSSLENMKTTFQQCSQLTSVNFSNFDTSKVTSMSWMFEGCGNLETVTFGNINTSSLQDMAGLFCNCYKLTSTDLWYFDTSKVTDMNHLFTNCQVLEYLNLSNFNTSKVQNMENFFLDCLALKYLNVKNFQLPSSITASTLFSSLSSKAIICIHDNALKNSLSSENRISFCSDDCYSLSNTKIDINEEKCLASCSQSENNNYEYNSFCYNKCPQGTLVNGYQCLINECESNPNSSECQCLINECESNPNSSECSGENPLGYYYDSTDKIYKKCYEKCYSCFGEGNENNNNCIECKENLIFLNDTFNITNCYENCSYYYYFAESNTHHCTERNECPEKYSKLIEEKRQCIYENTFNLE